MELDLSALPVLPTTVVGSYSVPEWLGRLKTEYYQNRISGQHLSEIHEVAIKAALKDQELAGIDIVSDGELRRDNDTDYFLARIPGVVIPRRGKDDYFDYYEALVTQPLPERGDTTVSLAEDFAFTRCQTGRPIKFSFTGPFSLSRRIRGDAYADPGELVRALARWLNAQARDLAGAGARLLQIDEPFLAGYREQVDLAIEAVNIVTEGVDATWALHVCYGNRYARPSWEGHYDFLFPAVLGAKVDQVVLEFARKGLDDLRLLKHHGWDRELGFGVIDVKSPAVESADLVASRIRRALEYVPADRLMINPDCGLRHLPPDIARAKLQAMVAGAAQVRGELTGPPASDGEVMTVGEAMTNGKAATRTSPPNPGKQSPARKPLAKQPPTAKPATGQPQTSQPQTRQTQTSQPQGPTRQGRANDQS